MITPRGRLLTILSAGLLTAAALGATAPVRAAAASTPHVMVIVEENAAYDHALGSPYIVGNPAAPYINKTLVADNVSATNWYSVEHVSDYDYYDLVSGADQRGKSKPLGGTTFVDQLASSGISWKAYMEGMPTPCYTGGQTNHYVAGHDPFIHFKSIVNNPAQCANVVPYTQSQMTSDLNQATPPSFVWITPNQCDDMHSKCGSGSNPVKQGDSWLATTIPAVQSTQWYASGGIIVVTWDESVSSDSSGAPGTSDSGGHIATFVIRAGGSAAYTAAGDDFGTLNGLQHIYGVACLAASCDAAHGDLSGAFAVAAGSTQTSSPSRPGSGAVAQPATIRTRWGGLTRR